MNTSPLKVLIVGAGTVAGGVPQYVQTLARFTNPQHVKLHLVVSGDKPQAGAPQFETLLKHVCPLRYSLWSLPLRVLRLRRLLRRHRFDLMHLHAARAGLLGCLAALGMRTPVVYTGHAWSFPQKPTILARAFFYACERYICSRASAVTFLTRQHRDLGVTKRLLNPDKAIIIPTRIDTVRFTTVDIRDIAKQRCALGLSEGAPVIGTVARLDPLKDPTTFVLTAARLVPRIPGVSFLWVGDGPLRAQVAALASRLGIANRLIITGMLPNDRIPVLLKIMNVFLFASRIESFPLAILEAQASGTPVVTSGYSGVEQIIEHNKTGYIFPPGDLDKAALYAERLLIDTNTRDRIVNAAYNHVILNHSQPRAMARDFEQVYARVLRRDDLIV